MLQTELPLYTVVVSARARRMRLEVTPLGEVRVTIPRRFRSDHIPDFVARHQPWITRALAHLQQQRSANPQLYTLQPRQIELAALNKRWSVNYVSGARTKVHDNPSADPHKESRELIVTTATHNNSGAALRAWLHQTAQNHLVPWLADLSALHGLPYAKASIRGQQTRWGSCSARKTISLNRALLFLPRDLVDYLLVHELCHTQHLNHSKRYWALVARCDPDYLRKERALNDAQRWIPTWAHNTA